MYWKAIGWGLFFQAGGLQICQIDTPVQVFPYNICDFFQKVLFYKRLQKVVSLFVKLRVFILIFLKDLRDILIKMFKAV